MSYQSSEISESYLKKHLGLKIPQNMRELMDKVIPKRYYFYHVLLHSFTHIWGILTKCHPEDILGKWKS